MAIKNLSTIQHELAHSVDLTSRQYNRDIIDSVLSVSGSVNFNNITSGSAGAEDPGVKGNLFVTSSEALGGAAPFYDVVCISRG